jgi:hypothetical protein
MGNFLAAQKYREINRPNRLMRLFFLPFSTKPMSSFQKSLVFSLCFLLITLTGCDVIMDIFQAGMWAMLIIIVLVVVLVSWLFRKIRGR